MSVKLLVSHFDDCDSCGSPNEEEVWLIIVGENRLALCHGCFAKHIEVMHENPLEVDEGDDEGDSV